MRRTLALVAVVAAALAGSPAGAQSIPNITAAKSAATNAANAANAHTAAVNGTASEKPAPSKPAAQPAKPQPAKAQPAKAQPAKAQPGKAQPASAKPEARPEAKPAATKTDAKAAKPEAKPDPKAAKPDAKPEPKVDAKADQSRAGASAGRDSAQTIKVGASTSVATRGAASELTFSREIYSYPGRGRRDPFMSLLKSGDLRPLLSDLKLVTVLYDPTGRNSVAILRDLSTKPNDQYRVKLGQQLGRMRVAQIQPKQIVLTIEEFGYNRQETLALTSDSTRTR